MEKRQISKAVIARLPRYYRFLGELLDAGIERISSGDLSEKIQVTASQIRQDLNNFGGFGQQGYGYNVAYLREEIGKILGLDRGHSFIIIGAGNLGQALANYASFEKNGFVLKGIFDVREELSGKSVRGIPIRMWEELEEFLKETPIDIAALTVPSVRAFEAAEFLIRHKVRGIWNFTNVELNLTAKDVMIENVYLSDSLMRLSYRISEQGQD